MAHLNDPCDFVHQLKFDDIPSDVVHCAKRCLLDTIAVASAGRQTEAAEATTTVANQFFSAQNDTDLASILFDNRKASLVGAALANGTMVGSVDAHDTDMTCKGHVGGAVIPAVLAMAEKHPMTGKEFLTTMIVGYEIAHRAGATLHKTVPEYHTSGAWVSIGCAAVTSRTLKLTREQTRHAHGIAEYNGVRGQMMRCIEWPTMVKESLGWGSMVGISSALLAQNGFTGAPAITVEGQEEPVRQTWQDLGQKWSMRVQHFKAYPVCFWAQSAMASLREVLANEPEPIKCDQIQSVKVYTYHYATQLHVTRPKATDEAQYSLPYPIACLLVRGKCGGNEVIPPTIFDPEILKIAEKVELFVVDEYEQAQADDSGYYSHVHLHLKRGDGTERVIKGPKRQPWGKVGGMPGILTDDDVRTKAREYLSHQLSGEQSNGLIDTIWNFEKVENAIDGLKIIFK